MSVGVIKSSLKEVNFKIKELLDGIGYFPKKNQIVIKPNLVAPVPPERGVITHPLVTKAIIEYLKDFSSTKEILILESASVAQNTKRVFELTGYKKMADELGVQLLDVEDVKKKEVPWHYGVIEIPEMVFTHEYINVAKMKTHIGAKVSLGMKNQKGLISNNDKKKFHLKYNLTDAIARLTDIVKPDLTVIDGIIALEGDGPGGAGIPIEMETLIAGENIVEVDNAGIYAMGFEKGEVEYIPPCDFSVCYGDLDKIKRSFLRARTNHLQLGNVNFYSCRGCSGCTESLAMGLKRLPKNLYMKDINVISGIEPFLPNKKYPIICYGNCSKKFALKYGFPIIEGCPPTMDAIYRFASEKVYE